MIKGIHTSVSMKFVKRELELIHYDVYTKMQHAFFCYCSIIVTTVQYLSPALHKNFTETDFDFKVRKILTDS